MDNPLKTESNLTQLVLLNIGNIIIGIPQTDIVYVENSSQVIEGCLIENSSGQLHYNSIDIPVYTLNDKLKLLAKLNTENRICAVFKNTEKTPSFALMCTALEKYEKPANTIHSAIPKIMQNQISPINGFIKKDNQLFLIGNADSFNRYIKSCEVTPTAILEDA